MAFTMVSPAGSVGSVKITVVARSAAPYDVKLEGKRSKLLCVSSIDYTTLVEREEFLRIARSIYAVVAAAK